MIFQVAILSGRAQQPQQQGATETVTVSAGESRRVDDAIHDLQQNDDKFIATTVAANIRQLALAMAQSTRIYRVGPLTDSESAVVDLVAALRRHASDDGPIHLQVRTSATEQNPEVFTLRSSGFVQFCADLVSGGIFRSAYAQDVKRIVLSRIVVDLSTQQGELIPDSQVFVGLMKTFSDEDRSGIISYRGCSTLPRR